MWPNPRETADLVTCTEEILNEKLHFLFAFVNFKQKRILLKTFLESHFVSYGCTITE